MDAGRARQEIDDIRSEYLEPEAVDDSEIISDDAFIDGLSRSRSTGGLEFDLGNGNSFTFGLEQNNCKTSMTATLGSKLF